MPLKRPPTALFLLALAACAALSVVIAVSAGGSALSPVQLWTALNDTGSAEHSLAHTLVFDLRLPRALTAFATGATLAVAGVLMQVLLRNPLADPYILGISGGASVGAIGAMLLSLSGAWIDAGAFGGALAATLLVFGLAHGAGGWTPIRLLLTGVVVAAGCGAVVSLMLALGSESKLRGMVFWLMGDLSLAAAPARIFVTLIAGLAMALAFSRHLDVLARGETQAQTLGLHVGRARIGIFLVSSLLTAAAVTTAGAIGFIGLVTPHLVRMILVRMTMSSHHRVVLPAAALLGGALLVLADVLARTLIAPRQLPVGALTALIGVPLFLTLIRRQRLVS